MSLRIVRKSGLRAVTLIDCIVAMPLVGERLQSALITKLEKAKKSPAMSPQPSVAKKLEAKSR